METQPQKPFEIFRLSNLPSAALFENMAQAAQMISQAQLSYGQALLRANAAMFGAWLPKPAASSDAEGPAQAARESEFTQP